jgi:chain length determinant protein tyrosine kinase EpsG
MTFQQMFAVVQARWRLALLILLSVVSTVMAISFALERKYTASASVMLDVANPDPVAGLSAGTLMTPTYMSTQVDLLGSERVARRAIEILGLSDDPAWRAKWERSTEGRGEYQAWLASVLHRALEVRLSRESNVIAVHYTDSDPRFAASVANAFVQGYIDTALKLRVDSASEYTKLFDDRARQLRREVEEAQARLAAFQREHGLMGDGRQDIEATRLSELSSQLVMLEALAAESRSRQAAASARPEQLPEVLSNPLVAQLNADLAREEARMRELKQRLGDAHPQVIEQGARIAELRARIGSATARASGSVNVADNVNQARLARLNEALQAQRAKVLQLRSARDEVVVLERDVENTQRAYDAMLQRIDQTSLISKSTQTNVSVIKRATEPVAPSSPKMTLNAAAASIVGIMAALSTVLLRELYDRRVRTREDVLIELQQPLLASVPDAPLTLASDDTRRVHLVKARVLSGLARPPSAVTLHAWGAPSLNSHALRLDHAPGIAGGPKSATSDAESSELIDPSIGSILRGARRLTDEQIQQILSHQRGSGLRFGEAAVALKLVTHDDVVWALSQQFRYPYAPSGAIRNPEVIVAVSPFSDESEVFRDLRSQLLLGALDPVDTKRALAVLSPNVGDGKTYVAANLAAAFSQLAGRTLLIDADMRTPRLQDVFEIGPGLAGLSSILSGRADADVIRPVVGLPNLFVLPAGAVPPNPLELVQHPAFGALMREMMNKFDYVIVDTPAATHGADSRVIAAKCGAALVVGRRGWSRMDSLERLSASLSKITDRLAGIVLNEH